MQKTIRKDQQPATLRHVATGLYALGIVLAGGWIVWSWTTPLALVVLVPMLGLLLAGRHFDRRAADLSRRREDDHAR
ncbi:MAG TPA: hypothetical protein VNN21_11990, partial [Dehalococcoidia bacterium]|nr:hypothetical protein [Dehalococcoidia bacterium]